MEAVTALGEAIAWLERAYEVAVESAPEDELLASVPDERIMGERRGT